MAAQGNGKAKKPKKPTAQNGHLNGSLKGTSKLSAPASLVPTQRKPNKTIMGILTNITAR
jgi:hypothetical protein